MQLLDAILAFALTMAALATVVTVIMEACLRIARMRKKNFIEVMKLLNSELKDGALGLSNEDRWDFFVRTVRNPAKAAADKLSISLKNAGDEFKAKSAGERIAEFGWAKVDGLNIGEKVLESLSQLFGAKKRAALFEDVSLEYMLRCLAQTETVKRASRTASDALKVEFNRIAQKYEEFGSSVSESFKNFSQYHSLLIGILLAIFANIDGLRIFEAYRADKDLAAAVIEKQEKFLQNHEEARKELIDFESKRNALLAEVKEAREAYHRALEQSAPKEALMEKRDALAKKNAELEDLTSLKAIQQTTQRAQKQIADLVALGVPMGWELYPGCPYGGDKKGWDLSSPRCKAIPATDRCKYTIGKKFGMERDHQVEGDVLNTLINDSKGFFVWFFSVFLTGILIGLGAPFWFDIAKRLSAIRKGLQSAAASSEYRLSAKNADGDPKERKKIVKNVLEQVSEEAASSTILVPKGRELLSPDGTISE